jgi:hypothetical protein
MKYSVQNIILFPEFLRINRSLTHRILICDKFVINRKISSFAGEVNHG